MHASGLFFLQGPGAEALPSDDSGNPSVGLEWKRVPLLLKEGVDLIQCGSWDCPGREDGNRIGKKSGGESAGLFPIF